MKTVYWNNSELLGIPTTFTMEEMITQYRISGWDAIVNEDYDGDGDMFRSMDTDEIIEDILSHDVEELGADTFTYARRGDTTIRIDLARPETSVDYRIDNEDWEASPFQSVKFRCGAGGDHAALEAVIEWLDGQS